MTNKLAPFSFSFHFVILRSHAIDLTFSHSSIPCPRHPLPSATASLYHCTLATRTTLRGRYQATRRRDTCTAVSLFQRVRHCTVSRLPDYRDKQPEKPRWMTRHAVTVAARDFRASIPRDPCFPALYWWCPVSFVTNGEHRVTLGYWNTVHW